tara:strand:+ start:2603 stop:2809 length:207 start_codon:yes stop_codon:yes gene_type:complete
MLVLKYKSKKLLKESIGTPLKYIETSLWGEEYQRNGEFVGANRPHITGLGREFFAQITMKDGLIAKVS